MFDYKNISIHRLGHDGFLIKFKEKLICIDPYQIKEHFNADYIFLTHFHKDHLSMDDIQKILKPDTIIVAPFACEEELQGVSQKKIFLKQEDRITLDNFTVNTLPAYNIDKFRSPGLLYHPKELGFVGFLFTFEETTLYHAGDTDIIPEMKGLNPDIALLPVSGVYAMTAQEAVKSIALIQPKIAIPMHYDTLVGSFADAQYFKDYASCEVVIL
ncbi:MAG: MBL fold metallo-hydrolase [bacterium]